MKFRITDDYGENFEVEEIKDDEMLEEEEIHDDFEESQEEEIHDEETLSPEDIAKLKGLIGVADKLMALVATNDEEEIEEDETITDDDEVVEEEVDETIGDDDIEEEEEVIDTAPISDSIGSMEKKSRKAKDSTDHQVEIANAWSENYAKFNRNK